MVDLSRTDRAMRHQYRHCHAALAEMPGDPYARRLGVPAACNTDNTPAAHEFQAAGMRLPSCIDPGRIDIEGDVRNQNALRPFNDSYWAAAGVTIIMTGLPSGSMA
jgi:hypothetical protein